MKVAIITSGLLPIPSVKGGAIEILVDSLVKENEKDINYNTEFTIYSLYNKEAKKESLKNNYLKTQYKYIHTANNFIIRLFNKLFKKNIPVNHLYQKKVIKLINKEKYDYVIIENYPELTLKIRNNKVIPYIHSDVFNKKTNKSTEILEKCYQVFCVSNFIKNEVVKINPQHENKVKTIYNSIDFEKYEDRLYEEYRNYYRNKYKINSEDVLFVFSGRISSEKGVLELANAFTSANMENAKLLIIGGVWYGINKTNAYLESIKSLNNDKIIFTGYISHNELSPLLCAGDIGVVPSICNEAAGLSVVEFMNARMKVIATNKGGIKEYLNLENNPLIDYKSLNDLEENLKREIIKSINEKENIKEIGLKNQIFAQKFSPYNNWKELICELNRK